MENLGNAKKKKKLKNEDISVTFYGKNMPTIPRFFLTSDLTFFVKCGREGQTKGLGSPIFADSWIVNVDLSHSTDTEFVYLYHEFVPIFHDQFSEFLFWFSESLLQQIEFGTEFVNINKLS